MLLVLVDVPALVVDLVAGALAAGALVVALVGVFVLVVDFVGVFCCCAAASPVTRRSATARASGRRCMGSKMRRSAVARQATLLT